MYVSICCSTQAKDPKSHVYVLSLKSKQPAFHLVRPEAHQTPTAEYVTFNKVGALISIAYYSFHSVIQAPQKIGGLSYNPSASAFHVYKKDHDVFMPRQSPSSPITPEDEEVAAILSNVPPPGEYVRRHYGH